MSIAETFKQELAHEAAVTRKYLERVPLDKPDFAPHAKSMKLGALTGHLSEIPGWTKETITQDELAFDSASYKPYVPSSTAEVLQRFDERLAAGLQVLEGVSDEAMMKPWRLSIDGHTLFEMPKAVVMRNMVLNHTVHHRAQLGVYLRLLDIPVPATYGPSADEQ